MEKIIMYAHAGSGNHGCEAIVRSSQKIIDCPIELYSMNLKQDLKYGIDTIVATIYEDVNKSITRYSLPWFTSRIETKLTGKINIQIYNHKKQMFDNINSGDVCISIGGDNYCYPGVEILAAENELIHKKGAKTVLWGCSVEPDLIQNKDIAKDLSRYDLITARESISYNALQKINPNTVLVSDPAFTLEATLLPLPDNWKVNNMVGINISPLILQNAANSDLTMDSYRELINYILSETNMGVAFIPHVVWETNNDLEPLKKLYNEFYDSKRVVLIEDHNCCELKGYISRCRFFVGARTHATIAAYSSCVPTLVLGYSVKSRGIARDIFGTEAHYVIPVQTLSRKNQLMDEFKFLVEYEDEIRRHLEYVMPDYINKSNISFIL